MHKVDKELILRAAGRDPDAFSELVQLQMKNMYRTAYAILMNDADAKDAVQDTAMTMWEKLPALRKPESFRTWCTRILVNCCFDIRKHRDTEVPLEEWEEPVSEDDYTLEWKEALLALGEKYRIPMELYYGQGYRISEIAELMDIPASTVRTRLSRGRECMKRYYANESGREVDG